MESVAASPETAIDLIARAGSLAAEAVTLVTGVMAAMEHETVRAALGNLADGLMEAAAALRPLSVTAELLAAARAAGAAEGFERGRREGCAHRGPRHLAVASRIPALKGFPVIQVRNCGHVTGTTRRHSRHGVHRALRTRV